MKDKLPWFKFEATAWISDPRVRLMTSRQRGWYIDLLCWAWQEGGFEPYTADVICHLARDREDADAEQRELITYEMKAVLKCFSFDCGDGRVSHPKLEEQRSQANESLKSRQEAARSTNEKRNAKRNGDRGANRDGDCTLRASKSNSVSSSSLVVLSGLEKESNCVKAFPQKSSQSKDPPGLHQDELYPDLQSAYGEWAPHFVRADFIGPAWHEWSILDFTQKQAAIAGIRARSDRGDDPAFAPNPTKYLRGRESEWSRPPRPEPKPKVSAMQARINNL